MVADQGTRRAADLTTDDPTAVLQSAVRAAEQRMRRTHGQLRRYATDQAQREFAALRSGGILAEALEDRFDEMLRADDRYASGFAAATSDIWGRGLDYLCVLRLLTLMLTQRAMDGWAANGRRGHVVEALLKLTAQATLATNEIGALLEAGMIPGAMARWRSLYETFVVARVISLRGRLVAGRYLDQYWVELAAAAERGELLGPKSRLRGEARATFKFLQQQRDRAIAKHGAELRHHYGWAAKVTKKRRPTFEDVERVARSRRMRPMYRQSSQYVHTSPIGGFHSLAVPWDPTVLFSGPRHEGMREAGTRTAWTLVDVTAQLLQSLPLFWRSGDDTLEIWMQALGVLATETERQFAFGEIEYARRTQGGEAARAILTANPPPPRWPPPLMV